MVTGGRRCERSPSHQSGVCTFSTTLVQPLFTSSEKHFLWGCITPSPYISLLPPVSSHKLPNPPLDSDDSLRELGFRVCKSTLKDLP